MKAEEMYSGAQRSRLASFKFPVYSGQRPSCLSERGLHCPIHCPQTHRDSESGHLPAPPRPQGWLRVCFAPRMRGHGRRKKGGPPQQGSRVRTRWALCPALLFTTACFRSELLLQPGPQTSSPHQGIPGRDQWLELGAFTRWSLAGEN